MTDNICLMNIWRIDGWGNEWDLTIIQELEKSRHNWIILKQSEGCLAVAEPQSLWVLNQRGESGQN